MKEKPILFSGPMVRAILDGRKTQTRRIVKPQPVMFHPQVIAGRLIDEEQDIMPCPYGQPGDRLWLREAWRVAACYDQHPGSWLAGKLTSRNVQYEAGGDTFLHGPALGRYRHGRFMPRWASRITLEITDVRVERLQDISEEDSWAEGIHDLAADNEQWDGDPDQGRKTFCLLWQSINGKDSWEQNPWVWVVSFRKLPTKGES